MTLFVKYQRLKPWLKKTIFFYVLIHLVAIISFSFSIHPVLKFESLNAREQEQIRNEWDQKKAEARSERHQRERSQWVERIAFIKKYSDANVDIPMDRNDPYFLYYANKALENVKNASNVSKRDIIVLVSLKSLIEDPNYESGYGETTYIPINDPGYRVNVINEYFLLTNDDAKQGNFWPFSKYKSESFQVGEFNKYTFLGVFSDYDWTEFTIYIILPILVLSLIRFYKKATQS